MMESITLEIGFDPTNPALRKYFARAGELAGKAFVRKMNDLCCEANGHEYEELPTETIALNDVSDLPFDAICKWCQHTRGRVLV